MFRMYEALRDNGMVQGSGNESFAIALCDPSRITGQISRNRAALMLGLFMPRMNRELIFSNVNIKNFS